MFVRPKHPNRLNLSGANLARADLPWADLTEADLTGAKLAGAKLAGAKLAGAKLAGAKLTGANLSGADLSVADLSGAKLTGAKLTGANLSGANLQGTKGLVSSVEWCNQHLNKTNNGWVAYKAVGNTTFAPPDHWRFEPQAVLDATPNIDQRLSCGAGVNVAGTLAWVKDQYPSSTYWRVLVPFDTTVVVPYGTDGKLRAARVILLEKVD